MPRFFITDENFLDNDRVVIEGQDAKHISRSLRMKVGENLTVCDFRNYEYLCTVERFADDSVYLKVNEKRLSLNELSVDTGLFCALLKGDKNDLVIQKSVELGVNKIIFFQSENCVSKIDGKTYENKIRRWNKIALEAAKQCGRAKVPEVIGIIKYSEILNYMPESSLKLFCYEKENKQSFKEILEEKVYKEVCVVTGPEGGFSDSEYEFAKNNGLVSVTLGKRILRAETAPIYVMSCIALLME